MAIVLIGYRGSGKSVVARALAARLGRTAVDADERLEARAGCTIRELFAVHGEPHFRALEETFLADLLEEPRTVIAAGGGAVLSPATRARLKLAEAVVWLRASVETLAGRIAGDAATQERRPPLTSGGVLAEIDSLLRRREPLYRECAAFAVDTDGRDVHEIVDEILNQLPASLREGAA
jgi:shikimate kinase